MNQISSAQQYSLAWMNMGTIILISNIVSLIPLYPILDHLFQSTSTYIQKTCAHINASIHQIDQFQYQLHQSLVDQLRQTLIGAVTLLQSVLFWCIDLYKSTYRCLFIFAIQSLIAIFTKLTAPIQAVAESVLSSFDQAADALGIAHTDSKVSNWTQSMVETQARVNQWVNGTDALHQWLSPPFEHLKQHINTSFVRDNTHALAPIQTYCNATPMIEDLLTAHVQFKYTLNIAMGLLIAAVVICTLVHLVYLRYRNPKSHHRHTPYFQLWWETQPYGMKICLGLAVVGLVTTHGLLAAITAQSTTMEPIRYDALNTTNQRIVQSESDINNQLFTTIRAFAVPINSTLDNVIQHISGLITDTVGGTIMENSAREVVNCLILNKLDTLQDGVEWIIDGGGVELPRMPWIASPPIEAPAMQHALINHLQSQSYLYWTLFTLWILGAIIHTYHTSRHE